MLRAIGQIRRMRGGAQSHLMRSSDENYYVVKFQNNPQHRRVLVKEMRGGSAGGTDPADRGVVHRGATDAHSVHRGIAVRIALRPPAPLCAGHAAGRGRGGRAHERLRSVGSKDAAPDSVSRDSCLCNRNGKRSLDSATWAVDLSSAYVTVSRAHALVAWG